MKQKSKDEQAKEIAQMLWRNSTLRHGLFTPNQFSGIVENMLRDYLSKQSDTSVCPYCNVAMTPFKYIGYYDGHNGWECDCEDIPGAEEVRGRYA